MSDLAKTSGGAAPAEHSQTLTDRVLARVADARLAVDRAPRPGKSRRRGKSLAGSAAAEVEQSREAESLRRVFRDLGISYRRYRSQTHEPVKPELREAAYKFRADPSLTSLVAVAAYLDDLDLLS
jgi:hypothetical protein